jgi:Porin subfamily
MNFWRYHFWRYRRRHRGIAVAPARRMVRALAIAVVTALPVATGAVAQTLTDPNPAPKLSLPRSSGVAKAAPIRPTKSCSQYGDGYVYVPASDTCVKLGGYVQFDAGVSR